MVIVSLNITTEGHVTVQYNSDTLSTNRQSNEEDKSINRQKLTLYQELGVLFQL